MPSIHRLRRGLRGYLILFAPHAFVPQRQDRSSELPSHSVFLLISTDLTPPPAIPLASPGLKPNSILGSHGVEPHDLTKDLFGRLRTLYAQ